jgi:hypothetical protein
MAQFTLDIGGSKFVTTLDTLRQQGDDHFFSVYAQRHRQAEENTLFVDRSPRLFSYILEYLRNGPVSLLPRNMHDRDALLLEAEFYQLEDMIQALRRFRVEDSVNFDITHSMKCTLTERSGGIIFGTKDPKDFYVSLRSYKSNGCDLSMGLVPSGKKLYKEHNTSLRSVLVEVDSREFPPNLPNYENTILLSTKPGNIENVPDWRSLDDDLQVRTWESDFRGPVEIWIEPTTLFEIDLPTIFINVPTFLLLRRIKHLSSFSARFIDNDGETVVSRVWTRTSQHLTLAWCSSVPFRMSNGWLQSPLKLGTVRILRNFSWRRVEIKVTDDIIRYSMMSLPGKQERMSCHAIGASAHRPCFLFRNGRCELYAQS